jgi:hypothetical protein
MFRRPLALALLVTSVLLAGCSSLNPSSSPTTTGVGGPVDCSVVKSSLAMLTSARSKLTTANDTTSKQIAAAVAKIEMATEALANQSRSALPAETGVWLDQTKAYNDQIQQGLRDGRSPTYLIQAAHSFDTAGYQNSAKAVGSYLSSACPNQ